ncbi:uncharacterized protein AMSG_00593 [Thecamonas trahens ATCC 50062]|uniref:DUF7630 domain-containing protein n=1 Tax=Thecamonas trahens ATCC 50062 TaxID=461836 RepID=A0A0L0D8V6_THETB|nr:hypothetical protein AMSG_00593 [Thecamonas trahens ATCC 50062]KNC48812.1 hypothetical protein AMSG_00593 [Thecamonas trahens ATCC 50062]|eukprot:XP_013762863.1 hypothetical protein AMSG_00593 [Thecamonas trahens ATCC 50062]
MSTDDEGGARLVAFGDVSGDGINDAVVVSKLGNGTLLWILNIGGAGRHWVTQAPIEPVPFALKPNLIAADDVDGDGDCDALVVATGAPTVVMWYANNDGVGGAWSGGNPISAGPLLAAATYIGLADIGRDGDMDLIFTGLDTGAIAWLEQTAPGVFAPTSITLASSVTRPGKALIIDADDDGFDDLVVVSGGEGLVWMRNMTGDPVLSLILSDAGTDLLHTRVFGTWMLCMSAELSYFCRLGPLGVFSIGKMRYFTSEALSGDVAIGAFYDDDSMGIVRINVDQLYIVRQHGPRDIGVNYALPLLPNQPVAVFSPDVTGDGKPDVVGLADNGTVALVINEPFAEPIFGRFLSAIISVTTTQLTPVDLDNDGDFDYFSSFADYIPYLSVVENFVATKFTPLSIVAPSPTPIRAADMDGDGDADVVYGVASLNGLFYQANTDGRTALADSVAIASGPTMLSAPTDVMLADMDADGDVDVVVACDNAPHLIWFANNGDASLGSRIVVATFASGVKAIRVTDIDDDGDPDIVYARGSAVGVATNSNGAGTSWTTASRSVGSGALTRIQIGDIDNDGDVDVAYLEAGGNLGWLANTAGVLGTPFVVASGLTPMPPQLELVYFDRDDTLDLVTLASPTSFGVWYNADGSGSFAGGMTLLGAKIGSAVDGFFVRDVDASGTADITAHEADGNVYVYVQNDISPFDVWKPTMYAADSPRVRGLLNSPFSPCASFAFGAGKTVRCLADIAAVTSNQCVRNTAIVPAGTYTGCRTTAHYLIKRAVELAADGAPGSVVVDCEPTRGVLWHVTQLDSSFLYSVGGLRLSGFDIRGMGTCTDVDNGGPGLLASTSGAYIELNATVLSGSDTSPIIGRKVTIGSGGGAVMVSKAARFAAYGSQVRDNSAGAGNPGGAIYAADASTVCIMDNSLVSGNVAPQASGGAIAALSNSVVVVGTGAALGDAEREWNVRANTAELSGGGIAAVARSTVTLNNGLVEGNSARGSGGGLFVSSETGVTIFGGSRFARNSALGAGGALALVTPLAATVSLSGTELAGNSAPLGAGVAAVSSTLFNDVIVVRSSVDFPRTAGDPPSDLATSSADVALSNVVFSSNTAARYGSALVACGVSVSISGAGSSFGSDDVMVCLPPSLDDSGFVPDRQSPAGLPWLWFDSEAWTSSGVSAHVATPPARLAWSQRPDPVLQPGNPIAGSVVVADWFGAGIVDTRLQVMVELAAASAAAGVGASGQDLVTVSSTSVPLPPLVLRVVEPGILPVAGTHVVVSVADESGEQSGAPELALDSVFDMGLCSIGRGGAVDENGFGCVFCDGETFSDEVSAAPCSTCPTNSVVASVNGSASECACVRGYYATSATLCSACPDGAICVGGKAPPVAAPGFTSGDAATLFLPCPTSEACAGGGACAPGYTARLCAECAKGYYALNGKCFKCKTGVNTLVVVVMVVGCLAVTAVLLAFNLAESVSYKFAAAMIGLNGLQITALYGKLDFDWGAFADVYFDVASSLNLNFELTSPECSVVPGTDVWVLKFLLTLALPILAAAVVLFVSGVFMGLSFISAPWLSQFIPAQVRNAAARCWWQLLVLMYMPLVAGAFSLFGCRKDASGRWVLSAAPARSCYTPTWWSLFVFGAAGVVGYGFGLPASVVYILHRERKQLESSVFVLRYGFLVGRFVEDAWWFEAAIMGRKLGVVLSMALFWADTTKAYASVCVLVGSFLDLATRAPYASRLHNWMAWVVLASVIVVLHAGTLTNKPLRTGGVVLGLVVNLFAIVIGNMIDIVRLQREEKETMDNEFYVSGNFSNNAVESRMGLRQSVTGLDVRSVGTDIEMQDVGLHALVSGTTLDSSDSMFHTTNLDSVAIDDTAPSLGSVALPSSRPARPDRKPSNVPDHVPPRPTHKPSRPAVGARAAPVRPARPARPLRIEPPHPDREN